MFVIPKDKITTPLLAKIKIATKNKIVTIYVVK